jgi:hypothetical protein
MPSKFAKQKSEALARARKALRQFSGELAAPILLKEEGPGLIHAISLRRKIAEHRNAKLGLLLAHYDIRPDDKNRWGKLSARLAEDLVPGMIAIISPSNKRRAPRKNQEWTMVRYRDLVREVDDIRAQSKLKLIEWAIKELLRLRPRKWGRYDKDSLKTRYHEGKREIRKMTELQASAGPLSKPPKT